MGNFIIRDDDKRKITVFGLVGNKNKTKQNKTKKCWAKNGVGNNNVCWAGIALIQEKPHPGTDRSFSKKRNYKWHHR